MKYKKLLKIHQKAKRIVDSDLEWDDKFDKIFSRKIARKVKFEWYDPDTSYQEDVEAFMREFDEYMKKQEIISKQINID
jgi:hypothetical protein